MRLLIELESVGNCVYDLKYHHKLQGFLYGLLKDTAYQDLHNRHGYKFFSFSNIFPSYDLQAGDTRHFLISSPDSSLIAVFKEKIDSVKLVHIGEMSFELKKVIMMQPEVRSSCNLFTGTPIVIRIPKANYSEYGIKPPADYAYVYWRKQYPFNAFIKQLEDNLHKKYTAFYGSSVLAAPLFEEFVFKKQVCNHVIIKGKEVKIFGSIWRFIFNSVSKEKKRMIQFGLDAGLGELNSLGFGFVNLSKGEKNV